MSETKPPFTVEVDDDGCSHCGTGKTWAVLGPDDVASSQSWFNEVDAQHFADEMNRAYEMGLLAARAARGEAPSIDAD